MNTMPIVIRKEYLDLMNGDHCAAAILNAFEMWSKNKADFIYKSVKQMHADFMGVYGKNRIGAAFKKLRDRGFRCNICFNHSLLFARWLADS